MKSLFCPSRWSGWRPPSPWCLWSSSGSSQAGCKLHTSPWRHIFPPSWQLLSETRSLCNSPPLVLHCPRCRRLYWCPGNLHRTCCLWSPGWQKQHVLHMTASLNTDSQILNLISSNRSGPQLSNVWKCSSHYLSSRPQTSFLSLWLSPEVIATDHHMKLTVTLRKLEDFSGFVVRKIWDDVRTTLNNLKNKSWVILETFCRINTTNISLYAYYVLLT